jgi:peptidoglycan hydrolase CwlO-like protein
MGGKSVSTIEKILHRAEDRIEEWRSQTQARKAEAEADRDKLWAEAKEREELLTEGAREAQSHRGSIEAVTDGRRFVFVVHSDEEARTLETFASERNRLVKVVPVKTSPEGDTDIKGSWLVFEASG